MSEFREFLSTVGYAILGLAVMAFMFALPFIGLGLGLGVASWVVCLLAPFC